MSEELRQRTPRLHDKGFLEFLHTKPCCVCGARKSIEAAHIRMGLTGLGRKPDDRCCTPLCSSCHRLQHKADERTFWASFGKDPFAIAAKLYAEYGGTGGKAKGPRKIKKRGPRSERVRIISSKRPWPHRALKGRSAWPQRKTGR